jgi:hypothetical protein
MLRPEIQAQSIRRTVEKRGVDLNQFAGLCVTQFNRIPKRANVEGCGVSCHVMHLIVGMEMKGAQLI